MQRFTKISRDETGARFQRCNMLKHAQLFTFQLNDFLDKLQTTRTFFSTSFTCVWETQAIVRRMIIDWKGEWREWMRL